MPTPATLPQLTDLWLEASLGVFNQESLELYRGLMETQVLPWFGNRTDITKEEVLAFREAKLAQGLSESALFIMCRVLGRILDYGAGHGLCVEPGWNLSLPSPKKKWGTVILSHEEEHRLSAFLTEEPCPMYLCLFLMLTTGMSVGEVLGAKWKDVSIKRNYVRVHVSRGPMLSRKRKTRKVPIGERQRIYLRKMMADDECYLSSGTTKPRQRSSLENRWRKVNDYLLLPFMSPTDLRHTFAVRKIEAGMGYAQLASCLGVENGQGFRSFYRELVSPEIRERLERERFEARKERVAPEHVNRGPRDEDSSVYRQKIALRRAELQQELDALEGDLAIIRSLRYSDCVQGANRQGLYSFIEKVLGDDKDGKYLVEYLRCNMRVADMPLLKETTVQAIRRRVTHGFEKLNRRLDEIYAVEGYDILGMFNSLCDAVLSVAPPVALKRGPKTKETVESRYKAAMSTLERLA